MANYRLPHSADSLGIGNPRVTFTIETPNDIAYTVVDYGWQIRLSGPDGGTLSARSFLKARNGQDRKPSYASARQNALAMLRELRIIH